MINSRRPAGPGQAPMSVGEMLGGIMQQMQMLMGRVNMIEQELGQQEQRTLLYTVRQAALERLVLLGMVGAGDEEKPLGLSAALFEAFAESPEGAALDQAFGAFCEAEWKRMQRQQLALLAAAKAQAAEQAANKPPDEEDGEPPEGTLVPGPEELADLTAAFPEFAGVLRRPCGLCRQVRRRAVGLGEGVVYLRCASCGHRTVWRPKVEEEAEDAVQASELSASEGPGDGAAPEAGGPDAAEHAEERTAAGHGVVAEPPDLAGGQDAEPLHV